MLPLLQDLKPKEQVKKLAELLQPYTNVPLSVKFGKHISEGVLETVALARQADMPNKPEKRDNKTPPCLSLGFRAGEETFTFQIVIEDISDVVLGLGKIKIVMDWGEVILQCK